VGRANLPNPQIFSNRRGKLANLELFPRNMGSVAIREIDECIFWRNARNFNVKFLTIIIIIIIITTMELWALTDAK